MYLFHYHTDYYELLDLTKGNDKLSSFVKEKSKLLDKDIYLEEYESLVINDVILPENVLVSESESESEIMTYITKKILRDIQDLTDYTIYLEEHKYLALIRITSSGKGTR
jgi:hypothetical protein